VTIVSELEKKVKEALEKVVDPETGLSVVEMGCIRGISEKDGEVIVEFVPTSPFCPIAFFLASSIKEAVERVEGVKSVKVFSRGHVMDEQINEYINKPRSSP
jgi:metal-sulfur cluster biosynthetic enzyme